ncbi:unnamed protein product [Rodentolepis nana]|uniref:RING-type domain-containing protein n=1 Tax=Rodentolepis nana TaxID=102285 RepID=A0A0R3TIX8_RODNA|nr:unnamed protein product [Rodentolepis nana]
MAATVQCPICLEEMKASIGMIGGCKHIFCYNCIKKWSEAKQTCPIDRTPFDTINILHEIGGAVVEEEKLEPQRLNEYDDSNDGFDIHNFWAHISASGLRFPTAQVMWDRDQHYLCFGCHAVLSADQTVLCRSCDIRFHTDCLINYSDDTTGIICQICGQSVP